MPSKSKKVKKLSPRIILFFAISSIVALIAIRTLILPVAQVFLSKNSVLQTEANIEIPEEELQRLVSEVESWARKSYEYFSLQAPNIETIDIEEGENYQKAFLITDPQSGDNLRLLFTVRETNARNILELLPEPEQLTDQYGITRLGKYDALRVGPTEPPYDTVTYFIIKNGYMYEINAIFSAPPSFLDQVLSTFRLNEDIFTDEETAQECIVAGCNGNICISKETFETYPFYTTCEAREDAVCYQDYGECGVTTSGECGWIENEEFNSCLADFEQTSEE